VGNNYKLQKCENRKRSFKNLLMNHEARKVQVYKIETVIVGIKVFQIMVPEGRMGPQ
jgi:hypothetical protein